MTDNPQPLKNQPQGPFARGAGLLITRAAAIVGLAAVVGAVHSAVVDPVRLSWRDNAQQAAPAPQTTTPLAAAPLEGDAVPSDTPAPGATTLIDPSTFGVDITLEQTRWLYENDAATFIDARNLDEYTEAHIDNALWMPAHQFKDEPPLNFFMIDFNKPIVLYCGGGDCDASDNTAIRIQMEEPSARMHVFKEGFPAWKAAGLPTRSGPDPLLEELQELEADTEGDTQ